jgi:hypothetical protein
MKSVLVVTMPLVFTNKGPGTLPRRVCWLLPDAFAHAASTSKPITHRFVNSRLQRPWPPTRNPFEPKLMGRVFATLNVGLFKGVVGAKNVPVRSLFGERPPKVAAEVAAAPAEEAQRRSKGKGRRLRADLDREISSVSARDVRQTNGGSGTDGATPGTHHPTPSS